MTLDAFHRAEAFNHDEDFFIYRAGAKIGLSGRSPYDLEAIRAEVAEQYPDDARLIDNCGFLLPPQAILLFSPFAILPYPISKLAWAALTGVSGVGALLLFRTFMTRPLAPSILLAFAPMAMFVNDVIRIGIVNVGQTTLVVVACIAAGQWCFERGRPWLGSVLWAIPFIKPHLALPLLPLAWYLGGWRRAAAILAVVGIANVIGASMAGRSPLLLIDYLDFLSSSHKAIAFNRVELNPQITSWNSLLYAATNERYGNDYLLEQNAVTTLAGYTVWFALLALRIGIAGVRPSPAWLAASCAIGAVLCCQVIPYELILVYLAIPWICESIQRRNWVIAAAMVSLMLAQTLPVELFTSLGLEAYRPIGTALLAVVVLLAGPCRDSERMQS